MTRLQSVEQVARQVATALEAAEESGTSAQVCEVAVLGILVGLAFGGAASAARGGVRLRVGNCSR
jgi:MFS-type transporter involved in bile tolerance (Atg22 family)